MYTLTIYLLSGTQVGFQYKTDIAGKHVLEKFQAAQEAQEAYGSHVKDDYGRVAYICHAEVAGMLGGDFAESLVGQIDASLIQARAQADGQSKALADPKLRFAASNLMPGGFKT